MTITKVEDEDEYLLASLNSSKLESLKPVYNC